jgi:hypothetical protein
VSDSARGRPSRAPLFSAPDANELQELVEQIAARVGQVLERRGLIERDLENAWLRDGAERGPLDDLLGHSMRMVRPARAGSHCTQASPSRHNSARSSGPFIDETRAGPGVLSFLSA